MAARSIASELVRFLHGLTGPVCLFDEARRLVFANQACADWTAVSLDKLIGTVASYTSVTKNGEAAAADLLCPPPEAFAGHNRSGLIHALSPEGLLRRRRADFQPLSRGNDSSSSAVLVLAEAKDIEPVEVGVMDATHLCGEANDDAQLLHDRLVRFRHEQTALYRLESLVGDSPAMQLARSQARTAIVSGASSTVVGPSGSGREHLARTIHYASAAVAQTQRPETQQQVLLTLDGMLLTPEVLVSALATVSGRGRTAAVTLLVLHLEAVPAATQLELLRLSGQRFNNLRFLATSQFAPEALLSDGRLHRQLAAAISPLVIRLPPLADRREDIPLLAQLTIEDLNAQGGKQLRGLTGEAIDALVAYPWPGNAAELRDFVAEAFRSAEGFEITAADLPRRLFYAAEAARRPLRTDEPIVLAEFLTGIERELIERALKQAKGNKARAARLLGLTRPRLYRRMVQLGLEEAASVARGGSPRPQRRTADGKRRRPDVAPHERGTVSAMSADDLDVTTPAIDDEAEFLEDIPFEEQPE
ncbi:MAG: helix-turn-helix domain-containing protein [Pirellulales bacterium]